MSMRPGNDFRPMPGERTYRALLLVYPRAFRRRYGESMVEFYRDRWRAEAGESRGRAAAWAIWQEILADAMRTAVLERVAELGVRHRSTFTAKEEGDAMGTLVQDLRYALRGMAARPAFTAI